MPFEEASVAGIEKMIQNLDWTCSKLLPNALEVLKKMLEFDSRKRITINEVFEHSFFASPDLHMAHYDVRRAERLLKLQMERSFIAQ